MNKVVFNDNYGVFMFKIVLACCLVLTLMSTACANESDVYPYIGATAGTALTVSKLSDPSGSLDMDFKPGYMAGMTAGIAFNTYYGWNVERIRVEAEVGYRSSDLEKNNYQGNSANMNGTIKVKNILLNAYFDNTEMQIFDVPVNIFLTAGAGVAVATISDIYWNNITVVESSKDSQFAYQGGLGVGYDLTKKIALEATYKYIGTTAFKFADVKADYGSHNILLGARYAFK